jgi:leucyl aminopeptidase
MVRSAASAGDVVGGCVMKQAIAVREGFDPVPSVGRVDALDIRVEARVASRLGFVGVLVASDGAVDPALGVDRDALAAAGFEGMTGQTLVVPTGAQPVVAVGVGPFASVDATALRTAGAEFARAASSSGDLTVVIGETGHADVALTAQSVVEGAVLARYFYGQLKRTVTEVLLDRLTIVVPEGSVAAASAGAERGRAFAAAGCLSRDLANSPPAHLTATRIAEVAVALGASRGLEVEVFDLDALIEMGCGGLLAVNGGSAEPPTMVKVDYRPAATDAPHLTFVGKALMYDSGGLSLKSGDAVHATMKNDMSGGGAVLAAMGALAALECPTAVTAYLMCTDNMPSSTAVKLGDVLTTRGGTTVEVINADAEGRLIMSDGLVLATESPTDAIVDIATLTGACMRALGTSIAGVLGNNQGVVDQLLGAGTRTDEPLWQLPLATQYRSQLDSDVADLRNLGGDNAGAITAALFLAEFVGDVPWAHVDIAGTAQSDGSAPWLTKGCTGFGARLLVDFALSFTRP